MTTSDDSRTPQDFITERTYLTGVSTRTVDWYKCSFRQFAGALDSKAVIVERIKALKDRGASHITINSYLRCINAYLRWLHQEHGRPLVKIPKLKEEQKIIPTLSADHVQRLIRFKPTSRCHVMVLTALDTGLRLGELLRLRRADVDLENLVLRVMGKGGKHRLVPVSLELRKVLYRHLRTHRHELVFCTRNGGVLSIHNSDRDFKQLCRDANITATSFHKLRHTFAVSYLRAGGNLYYLSRVLGHSNITTTEQYLRSLGIEDLQKVHDGLSLLSSKTYSI